MHLKLIFMRKVLHFSPVLKVRVFGTRKWFIISFVKDNMERWNQGGIWENEEQKQCTHAEPSSTASTGRGTHKKKERGIEVTILPFTTSKKKSIKQIHTGRWNTKEFKLVKGLYDNANPERKKKTKKAKTPKMINNNGRPPKMAEYKVQNEQMNKSRCLELSKKNYSRPCDY